MRLNFYLDLWSSNRLRGPPWHTTYRSRAFFGPTTIPMTPPLRESCYMGTTTTKERAAASASAGDEEEEEEEEKEEEEEYPAASSSAPAEGDGLSSAAAEREKNGTTNLSIIVHPAFTHLCASPPEVFCPLDWLPDEVIFNVCIHLVRPLSTSPP